MGSNHRRITTASRRPRIQSGKKPMQTSYARVPLWLLGRVPAPALELWTIYDSWSDGDGKTWRSNQEAMKALGWKSTKQVERMKQKLLEVGAITRDERTGMRDVIYLQYEPPWTRVACLVPQTPMSVAHVSKNSYSAMSSTESDTEIHDVGSRTGDMNTPLASNEVTDTRTTDTHVCGTEQAKLDDLRQRVAALQGMTA
jgi:hypothetical protein